MIGITALIRMVVVLIIVLTVVGSGYYIMNLKADLAIREANESRLRESIIEQQRLMDRMQADMKSIQAANAALNDTVKRQAADVTALTKKFSQDRQGNARDFGALAAEKPELVERLVNRGSAAAYRCIEIASGSPLTEQELAATTRDSINRECPSIANPNYRPGVDVGAMARSIEKAPAEKAPAEKATQPPPPKLPPPPGAKK